MITVKSCHRHGCLCSLNTVAFSRPNRVCKFHFLTSGFLVWTWDCRSHHRFVQAPEILRKLLPGHAGTEQLNNAAIADMMRSKMSQLACKQAAQADILCKVYVDVPSLFSELCHQKRCPLPLQDA
eukprot:4224862-Amphidinium_carterae.1